MVNDVWRKAYGVRRMVFGVWRTQWYIIVTLISCMVYSILCAAFQSLLIHHTPYTIHTYLDLLHGILPFTRCASEISRGYISFRLVVRKVAHVSV
jgi:hypothetical protein